MSARMSRISYIMAVVIGIPASFVVGAAVFADGPAILSSERLIPVIATFTILGIISSSAYRMFYAAAL